VKVPAIASKVRSAVICRRQVAAVAEKKLTDEGNGCDRHCVSE